MIGGDGTVPETIQARAKNRAKYAIARDLCVFAYHANTDAVTERARRLSKANCVRLVQQHEENVLPKHGLYRGEAVSAQLRPLYARLKISQFNRISLSVFILEYCVYLQCFVINMLIIIGL